MELEGRDRRVRPVVALHDAAHAAKREGRIGEAVSGYREMLRRAGAVLGPDRLALQATALHQITTLSPGALTAKDLATAEGVAAETAHGGAPGWTVRFALGQALGDDDPSQAFAWFEQANEMRRAALYYDADMMDRLFDALIQTFDASTVERLRAAGDASRRPVFIVGMPRSGTTLTEQALASLPGVHGAGELKAMAAVAKCIHEERGGWPFGAAKLSAGDVAGLAGAYLGEIAKIAPDAERVVDKMPANVQNVGLILSLFPNATILHMRRDPMDVCFACYRQLFSGNVDYAYDLEEIARYHNGTLRLMAHWQAIAPDAIHEVSYQRLVLDFEGETRRLSEAIGVPWSEACLDFHKTKRPIDTASAGQARRPLYTTSLGVAARFGTALKPLERALAA